MTKHSVLYSVLAISLAVISIIMTTPSPAPARMESQTRSFMPVHALTGVAFHAVSGAF